MVDPSGSETYSYNLLGEETQLQKVIGTTTYTTLYAYNLAGELTQATYPSGRVVQQSVDPIGRLCAVATSTTSCTSYSGPFATGYGYNTAMQLTGFNYGNGVSASLGYSTDGLLQLTSLAYSKGSTLLFGLNYFYKTDPTYCTSGASGNNGQIQCITDNVDNGRTVAYTYDALGRLSKALTTGSSGYPQWGFQWTYDRYGNRTAQTATAGSGLPQPSVTVNPATNQITSTGYAYDASGNATNDGFNTLVYDAENHAVSVSNTGASAAYSYDANSLRVQKAVTGGTSTVYIFSGSKVIAEYDNGAAVGSPSREYIYSGGALLAKIESNATVYYHQDGLSARVMTDSSGNVITQQGHYPYGELWYPSSAGTKWAFTTYERDAESTNDYAMARYYRNALGRFNSPDPLSGSIGDPQSLNRYSYSEDEPIDFTDTSGMARGIVATCSVEDDSGGGDCGDDAGGYGIGAAIFGGVSFWDMPWGLFSFDDFGNLTMLPDDWGSSKYNGGETFTNGSGDAMFGSNPELMTTSNIENLGLDLTGGSAGNGPGGGTSQSQNLKLVLTSDCLDGNGRWRDYQLIDTSTGQPPTVQYGVTEHFTPPGSGPTTSDGWNKFGDWLAPNFLSPGSVTENVQTFTIAPHSGYNNGSPVTVQLADGKDFGSLGIYMTYNGGPYPTVLVNGQDAPVKAPPGKLCASDDKGGGTH